MTPVWARFGRDGEQGLERRADRRRGRRAATAASAIAPAACCSPGSLAGSWSLAPSGCRRVGSQDFRRDQRHGPQPAQPGGDDEVECPEDEDFGSGAWGVWDDGKGGGGGLAAAAEPIASPAQSLRLDARPFGSTARSSRATAVARRPASRLGGRLASSRHSFEQLRRRPQLLADGEAQVAHSRSVCVEPQDPGGGRGALKRQAGAQRPGARRVAADDGVEQSEPGPGGEQGIALPSPFRSPAPRPEPVRPPETERAVGSRRRRISAPALRAGGAAQERPRRGRRVGREQGSGRRESLAHGGSLAAVCHLFKRGIRPACRGAGMSIRLPYRNMIREPARSPCQTPQIQPRRPPHGSPEGRSGAPPSDAGRGVGGFRVAARCPCPCRPDA